MQDLSPMMQHYLQMKEEYKDCILFYRLGDFYEMFFDDAKTVSRELELTLTGRNCGLEERAPMCGVPFHAAESYISRLVAKGYKVAICEQLEDPKTAKGMVKRDVIRIVTPGTKTDMESLDAQRNNYLMCIVYTDNRYGISTADITTGDYFVTEVDAERKLTDEINRFMPSEIICNSSFLMSGYDIDDLKTRLNIAVSALDSWYFGDELAQETLLSHFKVRTLEALGLADYDCGTIAAGSMLKYLYETQKNSLSNLLAIHPYSIGKYMMIDSSTRRNLELVETLREKQKRGSLLWVLDRTKTAMGARLLRSYVEQPLIDKEEILKRQKLIAAINEQAITREEIREYLTPIYDLERLITRITYQTANPRDLLAFKNSIGMLPPIKNLVAELTQDGDTSEKTGKPAQDGDTSAKNGKPARGQDGDTSANNGKPAHEQEDLAVEIGELLDGLEDLYALLDAAIVEDPPVSVREGDIIKSSYNEEVDRLRKAKTEGKSWLADLEAKEREKTGIKNLRIKYNKVFGYYLEVTNSFKDQVPDYYMRKQTLTNAERYITPELKELEDTILGAQDRLVSLEYDLFCEVRDKIGAEVGRVQSAAKGIAMLDAFVSLAVVAEQNRYVCPKINEKGVIDIKGGRHPVVEKIIKNELFIDNDAYLDNGKNRIAIITGPNMAGKSTFMRQTALIVLMAQIGSFVPATSANIGIVDRIFTRVGASDDLASGQSTFMVEMNEVANILRNATRNSLLILDEIGRGTSTFDGLSIAWAVVEHISNPKLLGAKTLFATHYHELTEIEGKLDNVHNYCIAVKEKNDDIVFLRKIIKGGADRSYGIQVAKMAGLPESVVNRAKEILGELIANDISDIAKSITVETGQTKKSKKKQPDEMDLAQISMFDAVSDDDIIDELRNVDISTMTPLEALNKLNELQSKVRNRW